MSCLPTPDVAPAAERPTDTGTVVLTVQRVAEGATAVEPDHAGISPVARFDVEGVIVGDDRSWTHARFDRVVGEDALEALHAAAAAADEAFVMAIDAQIDNLAVSFEVA